mgnify:CR=1 FL=1
MAVLYGGGCRGKARIVTGSRNHIVREWNVDSGQCLAVLSGHTGEVECLAVLDGGADDGSARVVSGSHDRSVRVRDLISGLSVSMLSVPAGTVMCLAALSVCERDVGLRVVPGSRDQRVLKGQTDRVDCVCVVEVSAGGCGGGSGETVPWVVLGSHDRTLLAWRGGRTANGGADGAAEDGGGPVVARVYGVNHGGRRWRRSWRMAAGWRRRASLGCPRPTGNFGRVILAVAGYPGP